MDRTINRRRGRNKGLFALTLGIVVALLAGGVLLIVKGSRSTPPEAAPLPPAEFTVEASAVPTSPFPPVITVGAGAAVSGTTGTGQGGQGSGDANPVSPGAGCEARVAASRVVIPDLCVDGPVVPTFQKDNGALVIPTDVSQVGVWDRGAPLLADDGDAPKTGTTLLAGHVNDASQGQGTLYNLTQVKPGMPILVSTADGTVTRWRVTALTSVVKAKLPDWVFSGPTGPRQLVLVTCGGPIEFIPGYGNTYRDNVIVTAVPA